MRIRLRDHLTYANLASTLALAIALGAGGAYAADLIGTSDLKNGAVTTPKIKGNAVTSGKVKDGQIGLADLNAGVNGILGEVDDKAPRTKTVMIPASAFRAIDGNTAIVNADGNGAYISGGGGEVLHGPVVIPTSSVITEITYFFRDDSPTFNLTLELVQIPPNTNIPSGLPGTSVTTANGGFTSITVPSLNVGVSGAPLQVVAAISPGGPNWSTQAALLTVKGVQITYTEAT